MRASYSPRPGVHRSKKAASATGGRFRFGGSEIERGHEQFVIALPGKHLGPFQRRQLRFARKLHEPRQRSACDGVIAMQRAIERDPVRRGGPAVLDFSAADQAHNTQDIAGQSRLGAKIRLGANIC
jgi:hypothetical protein